MTHPKQGYLLQNENNEWYFKPRRSRKTTHQYTILSNFVHNAENLVESHNLFRGWIQSKHALTQYQSSYAKLYHARRCTFLNTSDYTLLTETELIVTLNE